MTEPDWPFLRVVVNDRAAIYAEHFPGRLIAAGEATITWFSHDEAHLLLYTFAGAWPGLGRDSENESVRYVYRSDGNLVCRFRGLELAPGAIVIDDVVSL